MAPHFAPLSVNLQPSASARLKIGPSIQVDPRLCRTQQGGGAERREVDCCTHVGVIFSLSLSLSACPVGQFKWGTEGQCKGCPGFSQATIRGAATCSCRSGYLRAESDAPHTACTSKDYERGRVKKEENVEIPTRPAMVSW